MLKRAKKRRPFEDDEDVNPMNYLSNLSDAMLVLAVGMMLALVIAWNVDIVNQSPDSAPAETERMEDSFQSAYPVEGEETPLDESGLKEYGTVYIDENGNYYVVEAQEDAP